MSDMKGRSYICLQVSFKFPAMNRQTHLHSCHAQEKQGLHNCRAPEKQGLHNCRAPEKQGLHPGLDATGAPYAPSWTLRVRTRTWCRKQQFIRRNSNTHLHYT
jgi:hypothetical protein